MLAKISASCGLRTWALGLRFGAALPATLAFDHPTVEALTRWLSTAVLGEAQAPTVVTPTVAAEVPIAIVGMGCRLPGEVVDAGSYWRLLAEGREGIAEVPRERWDADAIYDPDPEVAGTATTRRGGFLRGIELFDARGERVLGHRQGFQAGLAIAADDLGGRRDQGQGRGRRAALRTAAIRRRRRRRQDRRSHLRPGHLSEP